LQKLAHLQRVGCHGGQIIDFNQSARLLQSPVQIAHNFARHLAQIDLHHRLHTGRNPRKLEQPIDQGPHTAGRGQYPLEIVAPFAIQLIVNLPIEAVTESLNLSERLLQIVRGDSRELLQLAIAAS
jgi:hypothetical protein